MRETLKRIVFVLLVAAACGSSSASRAVETTKGVTTTPVASSVAPKVSPSPSSKVETHAGVPVSTLANYRARVRAAVEPLEEFAKFCEMLSRNEKPEVWSKEGFNADVALEYPRRERYAMEKTRALLPPKERVELGGGAVEVSNSWLHGELYAFPRISNNDARARFMRGLAERLRALDARLAELEGAASEARDKDAERGRLNAILSDPDFNKQAQTGGALQRFIEQLVEWIREIFRSLFGNLGPINASGSPGVSRLAQVIVLALCGAVIVYVGWRVWSRRVRGAKPGKSKRKSRVVLGERLEEDQTAADLLEAAERLARAGDLRGAIRKAYIALLCELGDRNVVRLAQHKTNRDYLQAVRRASPQKLYAEMLPLTFNFELHWYGLQQASESDWRDFSARCRRALQII